MESTNLILSDYFEICLISKKIPFVQAFRRNMERVAFSSSFDQESAEILNASTERCFSLNRNVFLLWTLHNLNR